VRLVVVVLVVGHVRKVGVGEVVGRWVSVTGSGSPGSRPCSEMGEDGDGSIDG